jgi:hypothetical protein
MDWDVDEGREGYTRQTPSAYPAIHNAGLEKLEHKRQQQFRSIRREAGLGGLLTFAGGAWAVYLEIYQTGEPLQLNFNPPSPAVVCILGVLIWLHAKWRQASSK